jgi:PAS domain S-box-containing protein
MISVLYVDDEPGLLDICKLFLEGSGEIHVDTLTSAEDALKNPVSSSCDAIVSDYQMPGMDGLSFLRALRAQGNATPFILFTGKGREEVVIEALNNGADFYLQKGGDPKAQFAELEHKIRLSVEQRRIKTDLVESRQRLADILDFLPDATFAVDPEGRVFVWNQAMEKMTGVPAARVLGKGNQEYSSFITGDRSPLLIDMILSPQKAVQKEYGYFLKEGKTLTAEKNLCSSCKIPRTLWAKASPLFDRNGHLIGAIESIHDITDLKEAQKELLKKNEELSATYEQLAAMEQKIRVSEAFNREVIDSAKQGIVVTDCDLRISVWNKFMEELTGVPSSAMVGKRAGTVFPVLKTASTENLIKKSLSGDTGTSGDFRYTIRKTGKSGWVKGLYSPHYNVNGRIIGLIWIFQDINEHKRTEKALLAAHKKLDLLSGIIWHDIRNQLFALKGYLSVAAYEIKDPGAALSVKKGMMILDAIERQIFFAKEYAELGSVSAAWQNVNDCIMRAALKLPLSGIEIHIDRDPCDPEILADPLMEMVFFNLIDNTLRHGGGQVTSIQVSFQVSGNGLTIVFEDNGTGIPREDKEDLFKKGVGKDTGLGLFLSHEILSVTGIAIAENGIPGKGARFEIEVPEGMYRFCEE